MTDVSMRQMLEAGVHFGHQTGSEDRRPILRQTRCGDGEIDDGAITTDAQGRASVLLEGDEPHVSP